MRIKPHFKQKDTWLLICLVLLAIFLTGTIIGQILIRNMSRSITKNNQQIIGLHSQLTSAQTNLRYATSSLSDLKYTLSTMQGQGNPQNQNSNSQSSASTNSAGQAQTTSSTSYCDTYTKLCFTHPEHWTVSDPISSPSGDGGVTMESPHGSLMLTYQESNIKDSAPADFIVHSVTKLNSTIAIIGGYYVGAVEHTPLYALVTYTPTIRTGATIVLPTTATFQQKDENNYSVFVIQPGGQNFTTTQDANTWFSSPDGQAAFTIMESIYFKS